MVIQIPFKTNTNQFDIIVKRDLCVYKFKISKSKFRILNKITFSFILLT